MKSHRNLIGASEAALTLRLMLGPMRSWSDFLADLARENPKAVHVMGHQLFPVAVVHNRCARPLYDPKEVLAFVEKIWADDPSLRRYWRGIEMQEYEIDDSPLLPWRARQARPSTGGAIASL